MKKLLLILTALLLAVSLTACAASSDMSSGGMENGVPKNPSAGIGDSGAAGDEKADLAADGAAAGGAEKYGSAGAALTTCAPSMVPEGGVVYEMDFGADGIPDDEIYIPGNNIPPEAGTLTAGEWVDNDHYSFWKDLFQKSDTGWEEYRSLWDRAFCSRVFVTAQANGKPLENSAMTLTNAEGEVLWRARTDNEGKAYLFYSPSELSKGDLTVTSDFGGDITVTSGEEEIHFLIDSPENSSSKALDLALVVDTTGSMSDELSYLQKELESVIERSARDNGNIPVRLSVNFYRDDGDEYVVRDFDFTDDISHAVDILNQQNADGGGDNPEKVNAALDSAINGLSWNEDSTKLLFIVLDAPPHNDDNDAVAQMNELTYQAAEKGIRIIPILASGGDKETEFLMRDFALKTGGSYLFLTDDSGVSVGGHITPTTGAYTVEKLNDLMVKVINRYLANAAATAEYIDINVEFPQDSDTETTTAPPSTDIPTGNGEVTLTLLPEQNDDNRIFTFDLYNGKDVSYYYGDTFNLEKLVASEWVSVYPQKNPYPDTATLLEPGDHTVYKADTFYDWGVLEDGDYRIALHVFSTLEHETIYGYFSIPDIFPEKEITMTLSGTSGDSLEFLIYNGSEREYYYGLGFSLEKLVGDEWENIPPAEDFAVIEIAVLIEPGESSSFEAPVFTYWKELEDGVYRVVMNNRELYGLFRLKDGRAESIDPTEISALFNE